VSELLLGIDIGTSACKAALFQRNGAVVAEASESYPVHYPRPGWAEQDPEDWWQAACAAIRTLLRESGRAPSDIAGVGVDGQSWSAIPLSAEGRVLGRTPIWTDTRAAEVCARWQRKEAVQALFSRSGNELRPGYTLPKLLWLRENDPAVYDAADCFLQSNSYLVYRLTGERSQDHSQGYGLQCYDMERGCWDEEALTLFGIDEKKLPPLFECAAVVGGVSARAARETGLAPGTPVMAGGLDAACGTLGAGVLNPGETQEQGGQAGGMSICLDAPKMDRRLILGRHVVPGRWLLQGGTTGGGGALRWLRETLCPELSFREMDALAAQVPIGAEGVTFLPYLAGERSPLWLEGAKGVFYGLDFSKSRGHVIRAVLEGVACSLEHNLRIARQAGCRVETLRAMGGAANSPLWTQLKADLTGCRIQVPRAETATAWGAACLAGVGAGLFSFDSLPEVPVLRTYLPEEERTKQYQAVMDRYLRLVDRLVPLMEEETR